MIGLGKLVTDVKSYAKLLNSVGTGSIQKRPLTPVECAKFIQRLIDEEGESLEKIAERLDLGKSQNMSKIYKKRDTTQVIKFLNLLKVSEKSRNLAGWLYDDYPLIPFSTISEFSTFTPEEQNTIIQSIFNTKDKKKILGKEDVKKIKKWRKLNPDTSIDEYVKKVLKLKPVTITTHLVVSEINASLGQFIQTNPDYKKKILDILQESLDGEFYDIDAGNSVIAISMNETAYKIFHISQYNNGVSYTQFLNTLLENKIE